MPLLYTETDAGLGSSMGKSFDEVVPDDEVDLAMWLEDAFPLTAGVIGNELL